MVKNAGKQYDKHRENNHKQVCAIIQRQCENRQKCSLPSRTMWSALWWWALSLLRPHPRGCSPWHEFTGSSLVLFTSTSWHYCSAPQPTWAPVCALLQLWNAKDTMQWRKCRKPCKNHQCYFLFFSVRVRVTVRVVAVCCSPMWPHCYFCELCFNENKTNQPTKTTKRSRKPGKALQTFAGEVMQHMVGSLWAGAGQVDTHPGAVLDRGPRARSVQPNAGPAVPPCPVMGSWGQERRGAPAAGPAESNSSN